MDLRLAEGKILATALTNCQGKIEESGGSFKGHTNAGTDESLLSGKQC